MKKDLDKILKLVLILFLVWIGYCTYNFSNNGRYKSVTAGLILDTRTGTSYRIDGKWTKTYKLKLNEKKHEE